MLQLSRKYLKFNRGLLVILGSICYALGINQLQILDYGMGSFDSLTLQLTKITEIKQFGNASFLIHFTFFIVLLLLVKRYSLNMRMIILSIISILLLTRIVNILSYLNYYPNQSIIALIITFLLLNLGLFFLAKSNVIIVPFDKFLVETANYFEINFGIIRFIADITLLLIVFVINIAYNQVVPITLFTIIITFLTGVNIGIYEIIFKKVLK